MLRNGGEEELAALSGGTQEQIALLTRLAFARLLARTGRPIPVILDDPLAFADDARLPALLAALEAVGGRGADHRADLPRAPFADLPAIRPMLSLSDTAAAAAV